MYFQAENEFKSSINDFIFELISFSSNFYALIEKLRLSNCQKTFKDKRLFFIINPNFSNG